MVVKIVSFWEQGWNTPIKEYDLWQIKRWNAIKRHVAQVKKYCKKGDFSCRPRQRQALLHWAYDSRKI